MTDLNKDDLPVESEADSLRTIARNMGLNVGNLRDVTRLKELIAAEKAKTPTKATNDKRRTVREKALALQRIMITPLSPFDKQLKGITVSAGNKYLRNVQRHIPYDVPWHCEAILVNALKAKRYRVNQKKKGADGKETNSNRFHPAFNVIILDNLSEKEIQKLAAEQKARRSLED